MTDLTTTQMAGRLLGESCDDTAPSWNSCRSGPSDNHHDLPELTALLEIAVRVRRLVEGEGRVYDGLECRPAGSCLCGGVRYGCGAAISGR